MFSAMTNAVFAVGIDPQKLLESVGLIGLFIVVFAESGILIGFFLPGDSLLFTAGLATYGIKISEDGEIFQLAGGHIWIVMLGVTLAAIARRLVRRSLSGLNHVCSNRPMSKAPRSSSPSTGRSRSCSLDSFRLSEPSPRSSPGFPTCTTGHS